MVVRAGLLIKDSRLCPEAAVAIGARAPVRRYPPRRHVVPKGLRLRAAPVAATPQPTCLCTKGQESSSKIRSNEEAGWRRGCGVSSSGAEVFQTNLSMPREQGAVPQPQGRRGLQGSLDELRRPS
jgi:hypothetical protein